VPGMVLAPRFHEHDAPFRDRRGRSADRLGDSTRNRYTLGHVVREIGTGDLAFADFPESETLV
jgi:hypothetical protein